LTTVQEPSYTGPNEEGVSHAWTVVAIDIRINFSASSERIILPDPGPVDTTLPPSVPDGLDGSVLSGDVNDTVTLTWNASTDDQRVAGYNIYRDRPVQLSWQASTSSVKVAGYNVYRNNGYLTTVFATEFTEVVDAGAAFSYSIVAFDEFGNFSARSLPLSLLGDANQPPFFSDLSDQSLPVGVPWKLRLSPVDIDGGSAGILVSALPAGMENIDNLDGTRSLVWTPTLDDLGSYTITYSFHHCPTR